MFRILLFAYLGFVVILDLAAFALYIKMDPPRGGWQYLARVTDLTVIACTVAIAAQVIS